MGGKAPKTPPAPDPYAVAGAQTGSNVNTAVANSWLQNANETGPLGSVKYTQQKHKVQVTDPTTGAVSTKNQATFRTLKDPTTGATYKIPVFNRTTTLTPDQQKLLDQQEQLGQGLNDLAIGQTKRLAGHLDQPFNLDGLPEGAGQLTQDWEPYRGKVESAMMERMNPQLERDYSSLENRLVNQGLVRGSQAFNTAMDENRRQANDARTQVFLASGNEARAASAEERARGSFNETTRERRLQERKLMRDQPINEITALMNGGQVSMPQFAQYNSGSVAPTPVGDYIYKTADLQRQDANRAAQDNAAMWGAVGNIGAGLFRWSDARVKHDIHYVHTDERGIHWYTFRYNGTGIVQYGVMAQELLDVRPDAVHVDPITGFYYVNYGVL